MKPEPHFGRCLKELRRQRGLSVRALAAASGVSSVWITLVENDRRSIGLASVEKLASGLGLGEPELTQFRLSGLAASERSDLLKQSRKYGPGLNNSLAMCLERMGIRPGDIEEIETQPEVGADDLVRLVAALKTKAQHYRSDRNTGTGPEGGPFLEIRFKNGGRAWCEMLVAALPADDSRTGAVLNAARNPPRSLTRATASRRNPSTLNDQSKSKQSDPQ